MALWRVFVIITITNAYATVFAIEPYQQQLLQHTGRGRALSTSISKPCFISSSTSTGHRKGGSAATSKCQRPYFLISINSDNTGSMETEKDFFVSDAQVVHLGPAARILTEEFYSHKTNFITFQIEKLKTVLSLESTFPNKKTALDNQFSIRPLQQMIVACNAKNGEVVGFAEVDARPLRNDNNGAAADSASKYGTSDDILRSYMYNLAVDKKWKRKGIASALVLASEQFVSSAHDLCIEKRLYLRVRNCNHAAIALYENLGYKEMDPKTIHLSKEDINSGSLEDGELILFAKDLPMDAECVLD
eukprot:CAMPEP_0172321146 /NCGR_PEP_ID=MMETSP1058-20130122/42479_1 /TAXON_ID=83371 /ORGANISM="Detonula confervacea, Strain CCMP 353" /LENGTH=303 /DNA_ID=CAMNT_0013036575 /DNA_START=228 /DNA_END=1139 /DNA_ORIENTATION=+